MTPDTDELEALLEQLREVYAREGQRAEDYLEALRYTRYTNYWDYLHLDALLSLQLPRSNQQDELVFIIYHQITELYFKLVRYEIDQIVGAENLDTLDLPEKIRRTNTYFQLLEQSFGVMTQGMVPDQFLKLRKALLPASGFQSAQYRMIEIGCTDLIRLVEKRWRPSLEASTLEAQLDHIYWRQGAIDAQTGKKTLTLRQFEEKYDQQFRDYAHQVADSNLRRQYPRWLQKHPETRQKVHQLLRELDLLVNVRWPRAHLGAASHYLGGETRQKATGGTNWPEYLPPRRQQRMFFPELWNAHAHELWGTFMQDDPQSHHP